MRTPDDMGAVIVAYGDRAVSSARRTIAGLRRHMPRLPITVISDAQHGLDASSVIFADPRYGARWAKLNLLELCPYRYVLYMDADTEPLGDLQAGFAILSDGYDMALAPSINQDAEVLSHIAATERSATLAAVFIPLQLQAGVMFIQRNAATARLFAEWRLEWERYAQQDQAALIRALESSPVKIWLLGRDWNGGALIAHHFGEARN